jgi:predicted transcriptional regulator of viral defense system
MAATALSRETMRGLRPVQAKLILTLVEQKRSTFTRTEAAEIVGISIQGLANQLTDLVRRGWLERLGDGRYMVVPPEYGSEQTGESNVLALASASVPEGYIGWWNAASLHGFTTQVPYRVNVATPTPHRPRTLADSEVHYHALPARKYFGSTSRDVYGRQVRVSDHEKTIIDCLDRPRLCGGASELCRIVWGAEGKINWATMIEYLARFGSTSVVQRLGFICDLVGVVIPPDARSEMKKMMKPGTRSMLGERVSGAPGFRGAPIGYVAEWGITVSFSERELLGDVPKVVKHPDPPGITS